MSKKILYLTTRLPYPTIGGDRLRMYNLLKQLKQLGHDITVVSLITDDENLEDVKKHDEFFTNLVTVRFDKKLAYLNAVKAVFNDKPFIVQYFYSNAMQREVDRLIKENDFDVITGYMIRIAPYLEKHRSKNIIIDFVDAVSMMYERRIQIVNSLWDKFKIGIEFLKVKNYEKKCCKIFKTQTVISKFDKEYIEKFATKSNIHIVGNGVDTEFFKPIDAEKKNHICFVGAMRTIANCEAVKYFATEIFPLVKKEVADAKFIVVGANPRQDLIDKISRIEGIEITGKVDDVREYMKHCKVSICSTKIAGGVQNKILEAMSMGIPVVTTPEGAEGIGADKKTLQVAYTNEEYTQKVIELLKVSKKFNEISSNSREFILKNFSWRKVVEIFEKVIVEECNE